MKHSKAFMKPKLMHFLPISVILLLATFLRFYQLSNQSLWSDEGNSVALARRGFVEIAQRTAFDIHPPLYYWLLKICITFFGDSESGLRSLSVVLGIGLVFLIWLLGKRLFSPRVALIATLIATFSPLQVYYSQETRMYMLLTFLSSLTVLLALLLLDDGQTQGKTLIPVAYIVTVTAGLYTHYAYPIILVVVNSVALVWLFQNPKSKIQNPKSIGWFTLQLIPILLYLPWLPIAWRQITTWPSERQIRSLFTVLETISSTLLFGLSWPYGLGWLIMVSLGVILITSYWSVVSRQSSVVSRQWVQVKRTELSGRFSLALVWLWFLLPVILTIVIFSPAFLKFLLVATPPLALLIGVFIEQLAAVLNRKWLGYLVGGTALSILIGTMMLSLYHYYTDSRFARDNYRGIAQFIESVGGPEDAVILNAEGQQDVFNYYYEHNSAAPVYPLPRHRPLDEADTLTELQSIANQSKKIFAVYWATHQADPNGLIEGWLDTHLFKATDRWYGNVRLVSYASLRQDNELDIVPVDYQLGSDIRLTGYTIFESQIKPGDILQVALQWETEAPLSEDYTVFLQVLDQNNHLVGQRDAKPLVLTTAWPTKKPIVDTHGIFIEPGTPPGTHRLIVGLYNDQTGQRLPVNLAEEPGEDFVELGQIEVVRPRVPLPLAAFDIQVPMHEALLGVDLLGYDLYKVGHRSSPDTPLHPGDAVRLVAYWTLRNPDQRVVKLISINAVKTNGERIELMTTWSLAGTDYGIIREWQAGEIIRAQYDLFLTDLEPGVYRLELILYGVTSTDVDSVETKPFRVE